MLGTGMFVVNPPWQLADHVTAALRFFTALPGGDASWRFRVEELVGE
jgi:23S rRNA A2030 N6-methylase RlmJ